MTIAVIGFGLIGGSIAKSLKKKDPQMRIMAYSLNPSELEKAQDEGLVNVVLKDLDKRLSECDIILLCAPVESNIQMLEEIKPFLKDGAFITDVGSAKAAICQQATALQMEDCFIGGHPMAGSEASGFSASSDFLFANAYYIMTPLKANHPLEKKLSELITMMGGIPLVLDAQQHDEIMAAVSHLPHIVASALVNTVKAHDQNGSMKQLAAGGFRDITRIASASPAMWQSICSTNASAISAILDDYIHALMQAKAEIDRHDDRYIYNMFTESRDYRNSITSRVRGAITPEYTFSVDIADEVGAISTISVILASKGISIKNIGINNARDHGEGALRISFYEADAKDLAIEVLKRYRYDIRP